MDQAKLLKTPKFGDKKGQMWGQPSTALTVVAKKFMVSTVREPKFVRLELNQKVDSGAKLPCFSS